MAEKEAIIVVEGLSARYDGDVILENVSFEVYKGEIFIIMGESGCGKSTLLKHMVGLHRPYEGRIEINGVDIFAADYAEMNKVRMSIGVLFQTAALFGSMTLADNVALPIREYMHLSRETVDLIVRMKLGMVNLGGYGNHLPSELSGGMRIRAGLARAMALDPKILFLDEPSAGLDPVTAAEVDILIKSINEGMGTTMVIITQELESIFNIGARVIML
ncbi:MAG: ATP-binding cassette domain-containing protein, partial [Candidatus Sulfobium sp.]